jgi:3-oxoadipate enol-lactonase
MPFASLPDVKINYEWSGAENRPVLVFSNGLGTNMHMWDHQVAALSQHFRVLRSDTRGHGQSGVTPGPYSIEQLSRDVLQLLDALKIERAYFCGLSMGGMIGMSLGAKAANRFHKLALCNTAAKFDPEHMWTKRIEAVQSGGMKAVASTVFERWFTPGFRSTHLADTQAVLTMLEAANPEGYVACCAAVRDMDQRDILKDIHLPCLIVAGTHDPAAPPATAQALAKSIPGAEYVELPASHLSNIEASDEFNRQVLQFLQA